MNDEILAQRTWVTRITADPSAGFDDWQPYCQSAEGIFVQTNYEDTSPNLPPELNDGRDSLHAHVADETTLDNPSAPFNGPRYCLRSVIPEVRRFGEQSGCILVFGPSDYRTFLVTNGIDGRWAKLAGLDTLYQSPWQWANRFGSEQGFYRNSFGVNVLVSALGDDGDRYFLFRERNFRAAVRGISTVGSADEGLRRAFGNKLFDQKSSTDAAPDIDRCAWRAVREEIGLSEVELRGSRPILLSVGEVRTVHQPAALYYWPLSLTTAELRLHAALAQDRHLEFGELHFVKANLEAVLDFVQAQESSAPVESWVVAMALYSLKAKVQKRVFLSHSSHDKRFVKLLGRRLQDQGIFVWMDESELGIGDSLVSRLAEAVHSVDYVVVVLSKASVQSHWLRYEMEHAMADEVLYGRAKVLPILIEDCDLPAYLRNGKLYADFRTRASRKKALQQLLHTIAGP